MPVELRKRKAPAEPAPPPPAKKKTNPVKAAVEKTKAAIGGKKESAANGTAPASAPTAGSAISLEDFGGEIETHDGEKTTLKKLVDASGSGVVLFTYPKASTPGCEFADSMQVEGGAMELTYVQVPIKLACFATTTHR